MDGWDISEKLAALKLLAEKSGHKIEAIKEYRLAFGVGLKDAKDAVEALMSLRTVWDIPEGDRIETTTYVLVKPTSDSERYQCLPLIKWCQEMVARARVTENPKDSGWYQIESGDRVVANNIFGYYDAKVMADALNKAKGI